MLSTDWFQCFCVLFYSSKYCYKVRYSRKLVAIVIVCSVVAVGSVVVYVVVSLDDTAVVMSGCVVASVETEKYDKSNLKIYLNMLYNK